MAHRYEELAEWHEETAAIFEASLHEVSDGWRERNRLDARRHRQWAYRYRAKAMEFRARERGHRNSFAS